MLGFFSSDFSIIVSIMPSNGSKLFAKQERELILFI